jgi:thiol-disulfide isomerase/thioredoxin
LRVIGAPELEPEARTALQTEFLDAVRTTKYSRRSLSNALRLAESLEMHPDSTIAGAYYTELAALMKQSLNDQYIEIAEMLEATARRLKLPGNPMVITGATLAGEPFQWSKYKGKVVLVDFWATWCGPCLQELPNVLANYKKYHAQGFEVVGISVDENKEQLATFLKEQEIPWTTLFAEEGNQPAARYYNVTGIPTAILVGRDGKVLSLMAQGEILNDLLEKEFAKVPPAAVPAKPSPAPTN